MDSQQQKQDPEDRGPQSAPRLKRYLFFATLLALCLGLPGQARLASSLAQYYLDKYPLEERTAVRLGLEAVVPTWAPAVRVQASADILTYDRVIYHPTARHDFLKNMETVRRYRHLVEETCATYGVPPAPVLAIISWENSGGSGSVSPAACIGLGQLSQGAVERSHSMVAGLGARHQALARAAHIGDERFVPLCNIEDTVVFFDGLYQHYAGRADLAIAAYHNGEGNTDDLVRVWLHRHRSDLLPLTITAAVGASDVTYWDLWTDPYVREIMAGLRTMEGELANGRNGGAMLGDESDIYLWKVIGSYGALVSPVEVAPRLVERYQAVSDVAETQGLHLYLTDAAIRHSVAKGALVTVSGHLMLPETAGFLRQVQRTAARRVPGGKLRLNLGASMLTHAIPCLVLSGVPVLTPDAAVHQTGAAIDLRVGRDTAGHAVSDTLNYLFTMDRVYWREHRTAQPGVKIYHVTLNPRFGEDFLGP